MKTKFALGDLVIATSGFFKGVWGVVVDHDPSKKKYRVYIKIPFGEEMGVTIAGVKGRTSYVRIRFTQNNNLDIPRFMLADDPQLCYKWLSEKELRMFRVTGEEREESGVKTYRAEEECWDGMPEPLFKFKGPEKEKK